ncbi:uncharacterized protein PRCAT00004024001 [Priceomyces carsonii]|uniref:uncharacterized protein n=1 Tax=Priceomyces carsonii TaxID=28549 RepID=UPI002ED7C035|nr:unnamed protein product [Priceomyces carsonii]
MASPIFMSKPPPGFSILAIVRGIQLGLLGAYRTLQNPDLFKSKFYLRAISAIKISILIQIAINAPVFLLKWFLVTVNLFLKHKWKLNSLISDVNHFQKHVLNINVFLITLIRFFRDDLDEAFLLSLKYTDEVRLKKHPNEPEQAYYKGLVELPKYDNERSDSKVKNRYVRLVKSKFKNSTEFQAFLKRYLTNTSINLMIYLISRMPKIGSVVMALISFQVFNDKIGTVPSSIFICLLNVLPKYYNRIILAAFWGANNTTYDLLLPYFNRVKLTKFEKDQWVKSRQGVLFGFGLCYYFLINRFPWVSILTYGFAQSSSAYLITKITDPPPAQASALINWNPTQLIWNKDKENYILTGNFFKTDEGYRPLPGSSLFAI